MTGQAFGGGAAATAAHTEAAGTTGAETAGKSAAGKAVLGAKSVGGLGAAKLGMIVLDTPQVMELETGDPSPASQARSGKVRLIDVSLAEGLEPFDGQHATFSIDPEQTDWPSDASMPVGQPSTRDVHILH